jgi:hypothetical protein
MRRTTPSTLSRSRQRHSSRRSTPTFAAGWIKGGGSIFTSPIATRASKYLPERSLPLYTFVKKKNLDETRLNAPAWVFTLEYRLVKAPGV